MINLSAPMEQYSLSTPVYSDWECLPFGEGITFRPLAGKEPNWFHRTMQRLVFGVKWRKVKC